MLFHVFNSLKKMDTMEMVAFSEMIMLTKVRMNVIIVKPHCLWLGYL